MMMWNNEGVDPVVMDGWVETNRGLRYGIFGNSFIVVGETMPLIGDQAFSCFKIRCGGIQGQQLHESDVYNDQQYFQSGYAD